MNKRNQQFPATYLNQGPIVGPNGQPFPTGCNHLPVPASAEQTDNSRQISELIAAVKLNSEQIGQITQAISGNNNAQKTPEPAANPESDSSATLLKVQSAAGKMGCFSDAELERFSGGHVAEKRTYEQSMDLIFQKKAELEAQAPVISRGAIQLGTEEREKAWDGAAQALLRRWRPQSFTVDKLDENAKRFCVSASSLSMLFQHVRASQGKDVFSETIHQQITMDLGSGTKSSELVNIMARVAKISASKGYQEAPRNYEGLVNFTTSPNLKDMETVGLDGDFSLQEIAEEGAYPIAKLTDNGEKYSLKKAGKMIGITLETIIGDHLGLFTKIPFRLGKAAANREHKMVMALFHQNKSMADGLKLFSDHAHRGNVGTPGDLTVDNVSYGRKKMGTYRDSSGDAIFLYPEYIIHGIGMQTKVETFLNSISRYTENNVFANNNEGGASLKSIVSPYLDGISTSPNGWYLAAGKDQIDTIELAHLEYQKAVTIETLYKDNDTHYIKIRHFCGVGVQNFRGFFFNPGTGGTVPAELPLAASTEEDAEESATV
jgi:hypothetical protein